MSLEEYTPISNKIRPVLNYLTTEIGGTVWLLEYHWGYKLRWVGLDKSGYGIFFEKAYPFEELVQLEDPMILASEFVDDFRKDMGHHDIKWGHMKIEENSNEQSD